MTDYVKIHNQGRDAAMQNRGVDACKYDQDSKEYQAWYEGWWLSMDHLRYIKRFIGPYRTKRSKKGQ